jgi:hypothetical protein
MHLRVQREPTADDTTLGVLFLDGRFWMFTLEDAVRELAGQPVAAWKVPGATAIPVGTYRIGLTESVRFRRRLPLLLDVPGFAGIRIHPLNTSDQTEGCLGVGLARDDRHATILRSAVASQLVTDTLDLAVARGEPCTITVDAARP